MLQTYFISNPKPYIHGGTSNNAVSGLQFSFLNFDFINRNVSCNFISVSQTWPSGEKSEPCKQEIPSSIPKNISEAKLFELEIINSVSSRHEGLPPRG